MSGTKYFVCATPGSSGNFVSRLISGLTGASIVDFVELTYGQPVPDVITREFFFNNVQITTDSDVIVSVPFRPDFEKLDSRFPGCKIIVVTHALQECTNIARAYFKSYYGDTYHMGAEPFFRKMINDHSHLFTDVSCTPDTLTQKEYEICVKILAYQKLLDGFHSLSIPNNSNIIEITFQNLFFNLDFIQQQLEQFTGLPFSEREKTISKQLAAEFIHRYLTISKSPFAR